MEENHRHILENHYVEIRRVLDPDQVLPYVIEKGVMSEEDIAKIRAQTTRCQKVDAFMEVLVRSRPGAFDVFVKALEKVHPHLACLLLRSEVEDLKGAMHYPRKKHEMLSVESEMPMSKCEQLEKQLQEATVFKNKYEQLERQLVEATPFERKCEQLERQLKEATVFKSKYEQLERQLKEATVFKSKCKRLEKQLEEATVFKSKCEQLERQLQEATATSIRYQPEGTPGSVDGATSPADLSCFDFEVNLKKGVVTDQHIASLAQEIANDWMKLGFALGLESNLLDAIKANHLSDVNERSSSMLFKWKQKQGRHATYENLAEALDDKLVQRRDLVEKHCLESYSNTETPKTEGKGTRPTSAKIRAQLLIEKKAIEDDDKQLKELLESADGNTEESSNTMMEEKHRNLLRRFKKELLKDLDGLRLLPHMVDVLDQTDEDEIKAEATRVKQCDKLLEILPKRGPMAFTSFTKALLEVQPHLGHMLLQVD